MPKGAVNSPAAALARGTAVPVPEDTLCCSSRRLSPAPLPSPSQGSERPCLPPRPELGDGRPSLSFVHLFRKTNNQPPPPKTEPTNFTEATLRGRAPAVPATTPPATPRHEPRHGATAMRQGLATRSPVVPEAARPKAARSFPGGVGSADGQTDDGTAPLPGTPRPGQSPPRGGKSWGAGRAARQHKCWRRRHRGTGDQGTGTAWEQRRGPRHGSPAALQGKCWETGGGGRGRLKIN